MGKFFFKKFYNEIFFFFLNFEKGFMKKCILLVHLEVEKQLWGHFLFKKLGAVVVILAGERGGPPFFNYSSVENVCKV
jgi:hypothetical protein